MDALLLVVPLARANCHSGRGDFHMSAAGALTRRKPQRRRAVRLYRHPDALEAAVRRRAARRAVLDQPALGPRDRGGPLLRRRPPGPVVRHRPAGEHQARPRRCCATGLARPSLALARRDPRRLHHPAASRLRRCARGRADRAASGARRPGWRGASCSSPNNRAARAIQDAFVRRSGGGLLLPRLVPVGDPELDERIGGALEPLGEASRSRRRSSRSSG